MVPPLSEGCGAEAGVSARARDGRGAPRAVGPLAPARLLQGCAVPPLVGRLHAGGWAGGWAGGARAASHRVLHHSALACKKSFGRGRLQAATPVPTAAAPPEASELSLCLSLCLSLWTVPITVPITVIR